MELKQKEKKIESQFVDMWSLQWDDVNTGLIFKWGVTVEHSTDVEIKILQMYLIEPLKFMFSSKSNNLIVF